MDPPIKQHLAHAERHIAESMRTIARQEQIVAELDRNGHGTTMAQELLRQFRNSLEGHIHHRDRLRTALGLGPSD